MRRRLCEQEKKKRPKGRAYKRIQVRNGVLVATSLISRSLCRLWLTLHRLRPLAVQSPLRERRCRRGEEEGAELQLLNA